MLNKPLCLAIICTWLLSYCDQPQEVELACTDHSPESITDCSVEQTISADACILREVLTNEGLEKMVYHHDGRHYDRITKYEYYSGTERKEYEIEMTYDSRGRILTVNQYNPNARVESLFKYVANELHVNVVVYDTLGEVILILPTNKYLFGQDLPDSVYLLDYSSDFQPNAKYLMEYEDGNRTRFYEWDAAGDCEYYDQRWLMTSRSYYDDRPNVFDNYAILLASNFPEQYWFMSNRNNLIGYTYPLDPSMEPTINCLVFLTNGRGDFWIKENGNRTYYYDCEP